MGDTRLVVIGSNSFSGSHFIAHALEEGCVVAGISRSAEPHPVFLPYRSVARCAFSFHQLDLNNNLSSIIEVIRSFKPHYVVNFAAQSMVAQSWEHPEHWFLTNAVATVKLHDELRRFDFIERYVHISTPEVYGSCEGLVPEHTNYQPSTPYAVSRAAADMSLMSFVKAYGFAAAFTRAANVYGPGQQLYRIIPRTVLFFLLGRKLQLHGGGRSVRSFIHIRDVAEGTMRVCRSADNGDIFHFSTTRNISIRELVEMIAQRLNVSFEDNVEVTGERLGKDAAYLLDSTRARDKLGWAPAIELEAGIDETIRWVTDNFDALKQQPFDYIHKP